jgi:AcrR family transcriptional regulator
MQRANGEVRRAQILAASGQLVRRRGFTATRMADVAAELGLSAPLIVYHFRTKDELMAATLAAEAQGELERLEAVAAADLDPLAKLSRVVHLSLGAASVGDWALWIDAWGEGLRSATMRDLLADLDRRWLAAIEVVIADGQQAGVFLAPSPAASAARIMALLDGYGVQLVRAGSARARQRILAAGRAAVGEELGVTLRTR